MITFSQTLGTALGDWTADTGGLGYLGAAAIFAVMLGGVAASFFWTRLSRVLPFWAAFILTRPLGGDACAYLFSAQAGFISGQNLQLDGSSCVGLI